MPKLNTLLEIGFCAGFGDCDYRASMAIADLSHKEMQEFRAGMAHAIWAAEDIWKRNHKPPEGDAARDKISDNVVALVEKS